MFRAITINLPKDKKANGSLDIDNTFKKVETVLNRHEAAIGAMQPAFRVLTASGWWTPPDHFVFIDTTNNAVDYFLPDPIEMINSPINFDRLVIKWIRGPGANHARVIPPANILIDGAVNYQFAASNDDIEIVPSVLGGIYGYWIIS